MKESEKGRRKEISKEVRQKNEISGKVKERIIKKQIKKGGK